MMRCAVTSGPPRAREEEPPAALRMGFLSENRL
jgi:hypothetical protein